MGIAHRTIPHPPFFTVEEGRPYHDQIPGLHAKNLFLKDRKGQLWLVVLPAEKKADLNKLEKRLSAPRFSFGKPELLLETLGVPPGSVTPFALINDKDKKITLVIDEDMLHSEELNFHPLHNEASTIIKADDFLKMVKVFGYTPIIVNCGA